MKSKKKERWNSEKFIFEKREKGTWEPDPKKPLLMKKDKPNEVDYEAFTEAWLKAAKKNMTLNAFCEKYQWEGTGPNKGARKANTTKNNCNDKLRDAQDERGVPRSKQMQMPQLRNPKVPMPFTTDDLYHRLREFYSKNPEIEPARPKEIEVSDNQSNTTPNTKNTENKALADAK